MASPAEAKETNFKTFEIYRWVNIDIFFFKKTRKH